MRNNPVAFFFIPDRFKTQEMCIKALEANQRQLKYVPDWFLAHQQLKMWRNNDDYCNNDELIEWYEGHQKRKTQKAQIKKELMPIAWHPSRYWDWCMSEDEKQVTEKLWA